MIIGFVGLSHLGIVSSVAAAAKGFEVVAYDPDVALAQALAQGRWPIAEPQLHGLAATHRGRLRWTADPVELASCALIVIAADVPTGPGDRSDLSVIHRLIDTASAHVAPGTSLVILSQVTPGFTRQVAGTVARQHPDRRLGVFYQVETLVFGQAVERALKPERFIVGCDAPQDPLPAQYAAWLSAFECPVLTMRYESAEVAKIAVNMFLVSSICTTNTLTELCEALGADWSEIAPALALDRRIGPHAYLRPGLGLGGGNLERDLATVSALASTYGTEAGVVEAWLSNSAHRRDWALKWLHAEVLSRVDNPLVAVWGLAYKPHTHSTKHSPALTLLEALRPFDVRVYDPCATLNGAGSGSGKIRQVPSALEACRKADALVIMTAWPEFSQVSLSEVQAAMNGRVIVDPFGVLDARRCAQAGFVYRRLGSPIRQEDVVCSLTRP